MLHFTAVASYFCSMFIMFFTLLCEYSIALPKVYVHIRNHKMKNINILFAKKYEIRNEETENSDGNTKIFHKRFYYANIKT